MIRSDRDVKLSWNTVNTYGFVPLKLVDVYAHSVLSTVTREFGTPGHWLPRDRSGTETDNFPLSAPRAHDAPTSTF